MCLSSPFSFDDNIARKKNLNTTFSTTSNALDTEKHMQAFIEAELRKRRGQADGEAGPQGSERITSPVLPIDDSSRILSDLPASLKAEKSKIIQKGEADGSVNLSTGMLTSVVEIDLGIEYVVFSLSSISGSCVLTVNV
jgi:hypothetical protein